MSSTKEYLQYALDQLAALDEISYRPMMGEYILYWRGKVIGGVYDDRLLVKVTPSAKKLLPNAPLAVPYEGAKEMILADVDDSTMLCELFNAVASDLPAPKKRS